MQHVLKLTHHSFTFIVMYPKNEKYLKKIFEKKYLKKYLKYFSMFNLNTFAFKRICI